MINYVHITLCNLNCWWLYWCRQVITRVRKQKWQLAWHQSEARMIFFHKKQQHIRLPFKRSCPPKFSSTTEVSDESVYVPFDRPSSTQSNHTHWCYYPWSFCLPTRNIRTTGLHFFRSSKPGELPSSHNDNLRSSSRPSERTGIPFFYMCRRSSTRSDSLCVLGRVWLNFGRVEGIVVAVYLLWPLHCLGWFRCQLHYLNLLQSWRTFSVIHYSFLIHSLAGRLYTKMLHGS